MKLCAEPLNLFRVGEGSEEGLSVCSGVRAIMPAQTQTLASLVDWHDGMNDTHTHQTMFQASEPTFLTTRLIIISRLKALCQAMTKTRIPFDKEGYAALCYLYGCF